MRSILCLIFLIGIAFNSKSQNHSDTAEFKPKYKRGVLYTIQTTIDTKHTGYIVEETKDYIVIENRNTHEKTEINKSQIVVTNAKKQNNRYSEDIFGENEHATNYMLSGSALLFEEGQSISNNPYLIIQNIDYAFSENWAVSATTFFFYPLAIGAKCAFKINELNYFGFSANVMGNIFSTAASPAVFGGYSALGRFTHGNSNKNFTISSGIISLNSEFIGISSPTPFINIPFIAGAYCNRFSKRFAFNAEAWAFPQAMFALVGAGFKYVNNERIAWTFGCYTNLVSVNNTLKLDLKSLPIPYIGYTRKFN